ncbi:MAG: efflux RND transporter permease subunit, partial [Moraxellaceae bacterium]|nr:efflux RND transporter permease subunit [Moraxellaceae bacterium]
LHKISLGSLIIALGLLVDDAIIVVEMMVCKMEEGFDRLAASTHAFAATAMPMLTGTLITAIGFLPIGLAVSTVGEYTYAIFAVTTAALLISWFVSVYFVPYLGYRLLKTEAHAGAVIRTDHYPRLRRAVAWCISHRWSTIGMTLSAFVLGIVGMTQVEQQFFPASNRPEMLVDIWLPEGASMAASEALVRRVDKELRAEKGVASVSAFVGSSVPRFYLPIEQALPQSNFSQLIVLPESHEAREALRRKLPDLLATRFPEARTRVQLLPNGPPVTYPVMFRVLGPNAQTVTELAADVEKVVHADIAMRNTHDNWNEEVRTLVLAPDAARMQELGLGYTGLAASSNASLEGLTVGRVQDGDKLVDVVLRQPHTTYVDPASLNGASLSAVDGASVPLTQLGQLSLGWEPGLVWRQNGDFAMTIQGEVIDGVQANTVASRIDKVLDGLRQSLPPGYHIEVAGALAESGKGSDSINANVPLMLFLMFTLLMLQLRSFSRSLLVFLTGPLGIIGAAASMLLLGRPMGFVAMLGIIALNGMIIRNSLILVDQIEKEIAAGAEPWDAIIQAVAGRFRPIMLTAFAAVLAMIPLMQSTFWGPMAVAIMGGLVVATVLTLFSLPAMYAAWFGVKIPSGPHA